MCCGASICCNWWIVFHIDRFPSSRCMPISASLCVSLLFRRKQKHKQDKNDVQPLLHQPHRALRQPARGVPLASPRRWQDHGRVRLDRRKRAGPPLQDSHSFQEARVCRRSVSLLWHPLCLYLTSGLNVLKVAISTFSNNVAILSVFLLSRCKSSALLLLVNRSLDFTLIYSRSRTFRYGETSIIIYVQSTVP